MIEFWFNKLLRRSGIAKKITRTFLMFVRHSGMTRWLPFRAKSMYRTDDSSKPQCLRSSCWEYDWIVKRDNAHSRAHSCNRDGLTQRAIPTVSDGRESAAL